MPFIKYFFLGVTITFATVFSMAIYIEPLVGDLTRLGSVSERSWGWNQDLPIVSIYPSEPDSDVDLIVIGDSFSEKNIWQSVMKDLTGLRFKTYRWEDFYSPACLGVGISSLKKHFPNIQYIVIQTVERFAVDRFNAIDEKIDSCPTSINSSVRTEFTHTPSVRNKSLNYIPDALYTVKAFLSESKKYTHTIVSDFAYISPLIRNDLFSNKKSDNLLYYSGDLEKLNWTETEIKGSVQNLQKLNQLLAQLNIDVIFAIVPDKSTAYSKYITDRPLQAREPDIWQRLNDASLPSVNLKATFIEALSKRPDFYLPDDTHLSAIGYQRLASEISTYLTSGFKKHIKSN